MTRNKFFTPLAAVLTLMFFCACGGTYDESDDIGYDSTAPVLEVQITDAAIQLPSSAATGKTLFKFTNSGADEFEVKIEGPGIDKEVKVDAGATETVELDLQAGTYKVSSDHPAHSMGYNLTVSETGGMSTGERNGKANGTYPERPPTDRTYPERQPTDDDSTDDRSGNMMGRDSMSAGKDGVSDPNRIGTPSTPVVAPIEVRLTDSEMTMPTSVPAGQKSLTITNTSQQMQHFKIEGAGLDTPVEAKLSAGETKTIQVNLKAGTYKVKFGSIKELNVTP
jgi:hypothetical protein